MIQIAILPLLSAPNCVHRVLRPSGRPASSAAAPDAAIAVAARSGGGGHPAADGAAAAAADGGHHRRARSEMADIAVLSFVSIFVPEAMG